MTRGSVKEYVDAGPERYKRANHREKAKILDELNGVTVYHRKAAMRLLKSSPDRSRGRRKASQRRGVPQGSGTPCNALRMTTGSLAQGFYP